MSADPTAKTPAPWQEQLQIALMRAGQKGETPAEIFGPGGKYVLTKGGAAADPKTQARAAIEQQKAVGKAVARGRREGLGLVLARLGLEPVATGPNGEADAVERIANFAKAPKS